LVNYRTLTVALAVMVIVFIGAFAYEFNAYNGEASTASGLSNRVDALQNQLNSALGSISNLTSMLASAESTISTLDSQIASLHATVQEDQANMTALQAALQEDRASLTALDSQVAALQLALENDEATISFLRSELALLAPQFSQISYNYCVNSTSCFAGLSQSEPVGGLIAVSGGCPGPFTRFVDSLGNNFTVDASASTVIAGSVVEEIATAHAVNHNSSPAPDNLTLECGSSGTVGLQAETIVGIRVPFTVATGIGSCSSNCTEQLSTAPISFNQTRPYIALGVAYAFPGCGCSLAGPEYQIIIFHANRLLATEYSTAVPSPATFPLTDGVVPNQWLEIGTVFVGSA
jgi:hypothetical protein